MVESNEPIQQTDVTDAPVTDSPEPVDPFAWMTADQKKSYFDRNAPDHDAMVRAMQNRLSADQKKADAAEAKALGIDNEIADVPTEIELPVLPSERGEWDEGAAATAIATAEAAGVPLELMQEAINVYAKTGRPPMEADKAEAMLRRQLGEKYDDTLAAANAALDDFPAVKDWLIGSGFANDPGLIVWLAQQGGSRAAIQQQIDELQRDPSYLGGSHPKHDATVEAVRLKYKQLYG